ncbi:hypothetical protein D1BOALGB6SA_891 [Olavius sp. associated proteobacterium Delta 1]|nr:hypothetical protein D1BOALGB6SA_891 [Olavius sp. associated proteobacterium Delta 1]
MQQDNQNNKVVLITGGIGRASAERFLKDGFRVVIADLNKSLLNQALTVLEEKHPGNVISVECDVTKTDDCRRAVNTAIP